MADLPAGSAYAVDATFKLALLLKPWKGCAIECDRLIS